MENEKRKFKDSMEKEKEKFKAEMAAGKAELESLKVEMCQKNKALSDREWSVHRNEERLFKLAQQNREEKKKLKQSNLKFTKMENGKWKITDN